MTSTGALRNAAGRLALVLAFAAACASGPVVAHAQPEGKVLRIGAVSAGAPRSSPHWIALGQRLAELGHMSSMDR